MVACRFEELTVNTPRNRLLHTALESVLRLVKDRELQCPVRATVEPSRHYERRAQRRDRGRGRGKTDVVPAVAGSRGDDLGMVS
jgi:hypothetical protein